MTVSLRYMRMICRQSSKYTTEHSFALDPFLRNQRFNDFITARELMFILVAIEPTYSQFCMSQLIG